MQFRIMKIFPFLLIISNILHISIVEGFVCLPDSCSMVRCANIQCKENQLKREGVCGCCYVCVDLLDEDQQCPIALLGSPPSKAECREGLICLEGRCQKI